MTSGKKRRKSKKIIIPPYDDISEGIRNNQISVKSSKYEWELQNGSVLMAYRTLWSIFEEYQKEGKLPEQGVRFPNSEHLATR